MFNYQDHAAGYELTAKHRLKIYPKRKLYRTLSLARELRAIGKPFEFFTKNTIAFDLERRENNEYKRRIYIVGSLTCYKVRIDIWKCLESGDFTYTEYPEVTGHQLLNKLVALGVLPYDFVPDLPPYQKALITDL